MKLLMYSDVFGGPTTTFIYNDLIGLAKDHSVKYLCIRVSEGGAKYEDVVTVGYSVDPITRKIRWVLEKNGWRLDFYSRPFSEKVNEVIEGFGPDIIQCNFGYEALRLTDNLTVANKKIPLVINFLGYDASFHLNRSSYVNKLKKLSVRNNVFATSNTQFLKNNLESKGIYFQENRIIHTGVRLDFFDRKENYSTNEDEFIFLQIATLAKRKGQEVTLRSFKHLLANYHGKKKLILILAGGKEGEEGDAIRKMPDRLGIIDHVVFRDWISPEEARELMLRANCFVHHSVTVNGRTEGIPTAISEAMAMELPVISTVHAGIPELVEDGVNGYLVKENDVESYARRMKDIMSWGFKKINREKVKREFDIKQRTAAFEEYYEKILAFAG